MYHVYRHGGRNDSKWILRFSGSKDEARAYFDAVAKIMRQGGVKLIEIIDGSEPRLQSIVWAPRLRTRW